MSKEELAARLLELTHIVALQTRPAAVGKWPDIELTMPQLRALALLSEGPRRMSDLADRLGVSLSSATGMMDRLVGRELVTRSHDQADRRVVTCELTRHGNEAIERFWQISRSSIEQMVELLDTHETEKLIEATELLVRALGRKTTES